jgi:hypothetical protein
MKKTLLLSLILAGAFAVFPVANANAAEKVSSVSVGGSQPQWQQQQRRGRWGRDRTFIQTRTVRRGRFLYRETYRVRIHNGRTTTTLISRTRISR